MFMGNKSGMGRLQTQAAVAHSVRPLYPLSRSQDNRLYAETVRGRGVVVYFSAGQVDRLPALDMVYAVGGYLWLGSPPEVCWVGVDPTYGAALLLWHPEKGLRAVYRVSLPKLIRLKGYFPDGTVLLEEGTLQRDFGFVHSGFISLKMSEVRPEGVDDAHILLRPLPRYQVPPRSQTARKMAPIPMLSAGEYLSTDGCFFIRVAFGEGEVKSGSVWHIRSGVVQRASETLHDVSSILWHPLSNNSVLASTNAVYGERSGIYKWTPKSARWQVIRTFPEATGCRILWVSVKSTARLEVTDRKRTQVIEVSLR